METDLSLKPGGLNFYVSQPETQLGGWGSEITVTQNVLKYILVFGIFEIQGNFENPKKM